MLLIISVTEKLFQTKTRLKNKTCFKKYMEIIKPIKVIVKLLFGKQSFTVIYALKNRNVSEKHFVT